VYSYLENNFEIYSDVQDGDFQKLKGLNINGRHWDPKRHILGRNDVLWRIVRKNPFRVV